MTNCFTENIQAHLENENLSKIAKEISIPVSLLHDWIKGERLPSMKNIDHVKKIADYIGLSLDQLLTKESSKAKTVITSVTFEDENRKYRINIERIK